LLTLAGEFALKPAAEEPGAELGVELTTVRVMPPAPVGVPTINVAPDAPARAIGAAATREARASGLEIAPAPVSAEFKPPTEVPRMPATSSMVRLVNCAPSTAAGGSASSCASCAMPPSLTMSLNADEISLDSCSGAAFSSESSCAIVSLPSSSLAAPFKFNTLGAAASGTLTPACADALADAGDSAPEFAAGTAASAHATSAASAHAR